MLAESRPSKLGLLVFSFLMALASRSQAKTIMWLTNWYDSNMDSLIAMDSVYIPNYNGTNGYYFGTSPQMLVPTSAYAPVIAENVGNTEGLPTALTQLWYALPNWNSANYNGGEINVQIRDSAAMHQYNGATQPIQINYKYEDGQTGQLNQANNSAGLPGDVDACVNSIPGDTVWLSPTAKNPVGTYVGDFKFTCSDHNPFFVKVGTVHVYNPWPGKPDFIELGNQFYPTYPDSGRPGWYSTTLYTDPRNPLPFQVRVASGDPTAPGASGILYLDAGGLNGNANGTFFDFTTTPGTGGSVWILPPLVSTTSTITTKAPAVALSLYVQDPPWSTTTLRVVLKGVTADFVPVATQYCGWYLETFYTGAVPTNIVLSQPLGDTLFGAKGQEPLSTSLATYANWITVPPAAGTLWLTTNGVPSFSATEPASTTLCNTKVLAFSGYDYTDGTVAATAYEPFAQGQTGFVVDYPGTTTSTDNCPHSGGGVTEGLVQPTLNAQGRPTWSNKVDCDIGKANDGPQWWYDSLYRSSTGVLSSTAANGGTRLNAFHCIRVPLTMDASGYYDYTNLSFFPFDTATSVPAPYRPGTGDFHFAMHAKAAFEYTPACSSSSSATTTCGSSSTRSSPWTWVGSTVPSRAPSTWTTWV